MSISGNAGTNATTNGDAHVTDIYDAFSSTKNKTVRNFTGVANAAGGNISMVSGLWVSTSAVSTITLLAYSQGVASTFGVGARFSLYGVRG